MNEQISLQAENIQIKELWTPELLFWIKDLYHIYKNPYIETMAIKNLNHKINRGKFIAIIGPSGSGKTTLLNIMSCLLVPTTGRLYFKDAETEKIINLARLSLKQRTQFRRNNVGMIFQDYKLFDYLTVEENVEVPLLIKNIKFNSKEKKKNAITKVLTDCNIEHRRSYNIEQLSGGEKQRVQIAMAIISKPKIILADEPTGNLDTENSMKIFNLLRSIANKYQTSILTVSHDLRIKDYCDQIIELKN
ncbi:MAG: ABC transporter ATP-binding protein [Promethearchaeota archaeon]